MGHPGGLELILHSGFTQLGLKTRADMSSRFRTYFEELEEKNEVMNLTAITGEVDVAQLHFLDCAALLHFADFKNKSVIDIGSGAGFPGLPLKIVEPSIALTLLDCQQKRVDFLNDLCDKLGFSDIICVNSRAEELLPGFREASDIVVSRAVSRLNVLCELCLPYVKPGGLFIAMKGPDCAEEVKEADNAIRTLGGEVGGIHVYEIPDAFVRHSAVVIRKTGETPERYPRRFARIQSEPL